MTRNRYTILGNKCKSVHLRKINEIMEKQVVRTTKESAKGVSKYCSVRQRRCWAVIVEALQQFIPGNEDIDWKNSTPKELRNIIPFSEHDTFVVAINPKYIVSKGRSVKPTLLKMQKVNVIEEVDKDGIKHSYPLFYDIMEHNGEYSIGLPFLSLKWLLDFTKKMGYVSFCVESFIRLTNEATMMTYLYISSNLKRTFKDGTQGKWVTKIETLREWLGCPDKLSNRDFIRSYLTNAIGEYESKGTRLSFTFEVLRGKTEHKGRPGAFAIIFTVTDNGYPKPCDDYDGYDGTEVESLRGSNLMTATEEELRRYYENDNTSTQQEMGEAERWDEWDKIAEERRRQYNRHSA